MEIPPDGTKDREVLAIVNTFFMCVNWAFVFEIFNERKIWNLKAWLSVSLNLKARVEGIDV
jgi:hypothetical protein